MVEVIALQVVFCATVIAGCLRLGWMFAGVNTSQHRMVEAFQRDQDVIDEADMGECR